MTTQIFLQSQILQNKPDSFLRVDVNAQDLPQHFLGIAFDLLVPVDWQFDYLEPCGVFDFEDSNIFHLVSEQPELNRQPPMERVVFGLAIVGNQNSQTRSVQAPLKDGCVASFYFRPKNGANPDLIGQNLKNDAEISFEHQVLSVFNNGRRDFTDVNWKGLDVKNSDQVAIQAQNGSKSQENASQISSQETSEQSFSQQSLGFSTNFTNFTGSTLDFWQSFDPKITDVYGAVFWFLLCVLAVFTIVLVYFRMFKKTQYKPPADLE